MTPTWQRLSPRTRHTIAQAWAHHGETPEALWASLSPEDQHAVLSIARTRDPEAYRQIVAEAKRLRQQADPETNTALERLLEEAS